jgi:SAM-dependent methyltransferase
MDPALYEAEQAGRDRTAQRHMQFVSRFMQPGRLLDVGCASGAFLKCALRAGWKVAGVEPSSTLAESARRATGGDADIQSCGLQEAHFEARFDAITLWDVLEHVPDPIAFARACRNLLKPGGILFVNVPDIDSSVARLLAGRWPLLLPEHLNYFNTSALQGCAEAAGFSVIRFSSRMASFSIGYVLHRLAQHDIPGAGWASTWLHDSKLSRVVVSLPLGESLSAWRLASQDEG